MRTRRALSAFGLCLTLLFMFGCGSANNEPQSNTVAAPVLTPEAGTYSTEIDVVIATTTPEATIHYTSDGSTPSATAGTLYTGPVHVAVTTTLKAVAFRNGWTTSSVTSAAYTIAPLVSSPSFNPPAGIYPAAPDVMIATATAGASIRYTTDGTTPSDAVGTLYAGPVHVADSLTLRAVAFGFGIRTSAVATGSYTIGLHAAAPVFSPPPGTYSTAQNVTIATSTPGASIRYTTDGTTPTDAVGTLYAGPVPIASSLSLKAVAFLSGWTTSAVTTGAYQIGLIVADPELSVPPGTYATAKNVVITTATDGATIRYTTDGSTPTASHGTVYTSAVRVAKTLTLKAVAYRTGWTTSAVTTGDYKRVGVAAGSLHAAAAKSDGTVWCWGWNTDGQLGNGTTNPSQIPARITTLSDVVEVAAGYYHTAALKSDGTVWAWGRNFNGQLGDGTSTMRLSPVRTAGLSGITAIACGGSSTYALRSDGTVWAWGLNSQGQLGDGTETDRYAPVQVLGLSGVVAIAAGELHGLALESDGTIWAWGNNFYGQLGDGTTTTRLVPVEVPSLSGMAAIGAKGYHSAAIKSGGSLWAWGSGTYGELGIGDRPSILPYPTQAVGFAAAAAVDAGGFHTVAVIEDGTLRACGNNVYGQLGDGTNTDASVAVTVQAISGVVEAGAGLDFTVAIAGDGKVWTWGHNANYQLGDGTTTDRWQPAPIIF